MTFTSVEGIYKGGKVELTELPEDMPDETRVIVTFLASSLDLMKHGINEVQAADLRARLRTFADDWESPEMEAYDHYDAAKANL